jgi:hypothetical protein
MDLDGMHYDLQSATQPQKDIISFITIEKKISIFTMKKKQQG